MQIDEALQRNLALFGAQGWDEVLDFMQRGVVPTLITNEQYYVFVEIFSAFAHKQWSGWTNYQWEKCTLNADGSMTIPASLVDRWTRQANAPYDELSPEEQESDRNEARKMVELAIKLFYSVA